MVDLYWTGADGALASVATNWSTVSGGTGDGTVPASGDIAHFDSGGNTNCTWDLDVTCDITCDSTYTATITLGADINVNGLGTLTIYGTFDTDAVNNYALTTSQLTIYGTFNANNSELHVTTTTYGVYGIVVRAGGTFNGGSGTHHITSINNMGSSTFTTGTTELTYGAWSVVIAINNSPPSIPDGSLVRFTYAGQQSLALDSTISFYDLEIDKGAGNILKHYNPSSSVLVRNNLTITSGTFDTSDGTNSYDLTVDGDVTNAGIFIGNDSTISFGSLTNSGTFNSTSGTLTVTESVTNTGTFIGNSTAILNLGYDFDNTNGEIQGKVIITEGSREFKDNPLYSDTNLVSYWRFEGNANDEKNLNNGTVSGATIKTNGRFGQCYSFDGVDDYIDFGDDSSLIFDDTDAWSFAQWIKWNGPGGKSIVFFSGEHTITKIFGLRISSTNQFVFRDEAQTYHSFGSGSSTPYIDKWAHLVWVADGAGHLSLYINGSLFKTLDSVPTAAHIKEIGRGYSNNNYNFSGSIDDVYIFNRALSATEVATLYNAQDKYTFTNPTINGTGVETINATISGTTTITSGYLSIKNYNAVAGDYYLYGTLNWDTPTTYTLTSSTQLDNGINLNIKAPDTGTTTFTFDIDNVGLNSIIAESGTTFRVTDDVQVYTKTFTNDGTWDKSSGYGGDISTFGSPFEFAPYDSIAIQDDYYDDTSFYDTKVIA